MSSIPYAKLGTTYNAVSTGIAALDTYAKDSGLSPTIITLIRLRVSQINGCHFCVAMHCQEARAEQESAKRLDALCVWRESHYFNSEEKQVLAWAESLTDMTNPLEQRALQTEVFKEWGEAKFMAITTLIIAINAWNRLALSCDLDPQILDS